MSEIIIYVAGNPDAYPFEYYEEASHSYQGVIPDLLREFAAQSKYDIRYYGILEEDQRKEMGSYRQVDILSCIREDSEFIESGKRITLFTFADQDGLHTYDLVVLSQAPDSLYTDLAAYMEQHSQQEINGRMLEIVKEPLVDHQSEQQVVSLVLLVICCIAALIWLFQKYRQQLQYRRLDQERNPRLQIGNRNFLSRKFRLRIKDQNRILYCLFYFDIKTKAQSLKEETTMLKEVVAVLSEVVKEQDILASISDHQLILFQMCVNDEEINTMLQTIFQKLQEGPYEQMITVHAGVYRLTGDDWDLDEVLALGEYGADLAKRDQKPFVICTSEHVAMRKEQRQLCQDALQGWKQKEFQVYIQWYVDSDKKQILGAEALSRWQHPLKGLLEPGRYVPLLEKEHMVHQLDLYTLYAICDFLQQQWERGFQDLFVSCNISMETAVRADFLDGCRTVLKTCSFSAEQLILEIKGDYTGLDLKLLKHNLQCLKDLGIRLVLDGFHNDLTLLQKEDLCLWDGLKLDRSLIRTIGSESGDVLIPSLIAIGHRFHMTMMAEGVETKQQAERLKQWNCDVIQGFWIHKPTPLWEVERSLREKKELCL